MNYLSPEELGEPCKRCGAARSCQHRNVAPPVVLDFTRMPKSAAHANLKYDSVSKRSRDDRAVSVTGTVLRKARK